MPHSRSSWSPWLFPLTVATRTGEAVLRSFANALEEEPAERAVAAPDWTTGNHVRLELPTMRLREFAAGYEHAVPFIVVTPLALHGAVIADIAAGHSVMERLVGEGIAPLLLTECRSATAEMKYLSIASYLADLSTAIDDVGGRANLIGLCQGGWLALMLAARFPRKVQSLVLAGAPVDLDGAPSRIVDATRAMAPQLFEGLIAAGGGLVRGHKMRAFWRCADEDEIAIARILEVEAPPEPGLLARYAAWNDATLDMPGVYYCETVEKLFRRNELARGVFSALGRTLALRDVTVPLLILAGSEDDVVPPEQALSAASLVGTKADEVRTIIAPATHLGLFMGAKTVAGAWGEIAQWLERHGRDRGARSRPRSTVGRGGR